MAKKFLTPLNVLNLSSDPETGHEGEIYYNTTTKTLRIYANSAWGNVADALISGVSSLTGTTNEIDVSASTGAITISLPETINANTTGTAAALTNSRTIALSGDISGSVTFDGSASVDILTTIEPNSVVLGTDTTGDYVTQITATGNGISVIGTGESASVTIENTGVTSLIGTANEIDISASTGSITLSLPATINADTTGNANTATTLANSRIIELNGDVTGSASFNGGANATISASVDSSIARQSWVTDQGYLTESSASITYLTQSSASLTYLTQASANSIYAPLNSPTFTGTVTVPSPSNATDAVTKSYVDAIAEGLHIHPSAQTATTASIDLSTPPASIDGVTLTNNMRILVKNQATQSENGVYVYNSASASLTRASDFDTSAEIHGGDFIFITGGNTYDNTGWVQTEVVATVGSDPIIFQQFSGAGTYSAGTGLALDGTVFSNTGVLSLQGTTNEINVSASSGNITLSLPSTIDSDLNGNALTATSLQNSREISLSGDISGSALFDGSASAGITTTLANTSVSAASYGSASAVGTFTVDSKGRLTQASNTQIAIDQSAVTNLTTDLSAKAPLSSPTFTGIPAAPTASLGTNTTQIATTQFVNSEITNDAVLLAGSTMTGTLVTPAATTSISSIRIPHGTAPTSPVNGDIWTTSLGIYVRVNGVTVGPLAAGGEGGAGTDTVFFLAGM